jgi:hypothetical protein
MNTPKITDKFYSKTTGATRPPQGGTMTKLTEIVMLLAWAVMAYGFAQMLKMALNLLYGY